MKFMKKIAAMAAATAVAAVSLVSMGSMGASATDEPPYTAYLCISAGGDAQWKAGDWETESATITGDGVYSTSVTIPEDKGSETIEFLMLSTDINAYAFAPEGTSNPVADGTATTDPASTTEAPKNTDPNGTTADPSKTTAAGETTTTAAGGSNGGNNSSNGGSSGSSNGSTNNATTSQTGDFGIAAVVLGAVATAALGAGAYTITRKKK